jgi:hypothetical protein
MQKAGGIIALIAGIFGILAAIATLFVGGVGGAFKAAGASMVVGLGWGGILFSFLCITFGAVAISAKSKMPGILLIMSAIAGVVLGGTLVAVFMGLALIGGIIATVGAKASHEQDTAAPRSRGSVRDDEGGMDADAMIARYMQRQQSLDRDTPSQSIAAGFGRRKALP